MVVFYSPHYQIDIGAHVFPTRKYTRIFEQLRADSSRAFEFREPGPASWDEVALVHTPQYINKLKTGAFTIEELALLEVPWSHEVVEGFRLMTGGTLEAGRLAVARTAGPMVAHLGGGLHHAFASHGEGFCVFNDVAITVRALFAERRAASAAVIDLDVHHGNGTARIFEDDRRVFTFSMHQQHNYPMQKPAGSLDIGLEDGTGDAEFLAALGDSLPAVFSQTPDVVFYLAGADPYGDDQLGGLALTKAGLVARDRMVLRACQRRGVPAVVLLAGGYARKLDDTVDIHVATVRSASDLMQS
jgi:acetoin utilization deacetylase AcuC-like enzyme